MPHEFSASFVLSNEQIRITLGKRIASCEASKMFAPPPVYDQSPPLMAFTVKPLHHDQDLPPYSQGRRVIAFFT